MNSLVLDTTTYVTTATGTTCDASQAELASFVVLLDNGPLHFCAHHFRKNAATFAAADYPASHLPSFDSVDYADFVPGYQPVREPAA